MMKKILPLFLCLLAAMQAGADPRWKMHTTFDGTADYVYDTPAYTYFTSRAMPDLNGQRRMSLFRYDKEGDEIQNLSSDNALTSHTVSAVQYNPQKGYVVAVGTNYDITFLYDDGRVVNMPDYRLASIDYSKMVNSVTADPWHDRVYLATKFGYVAVNDEKYEIAESRVYDEEIKAAARIGNYFVMLKGTDLLVAEASATRFSLSDYEKRTFDTPYWISPLGENQALVFNYGGVHHKMNLVEDKDGGLVAERIGSDRYYNISCNGSGVLVPTVSSVIQVEPGGVMKTVGIPDDVAKLSVGSADFAEFWHADERKGLKSGRPAADGQTWTVTRDYMLPNSPSPFISTDMAVHPSRGAMVTNYGYDYNFNNYPRTSPVLLSGYSGGWWTDYAPAYTHPDRARIMMSSNGLAVDPDNPDYVYLSSVSQGFIRLNLADSSDIIHFSKPSDPDNGNPGFYELVPDPTHPDHKWACNFSAPRFDAAGNLWTSYADGVNQTPPAAYLFCWEAADRKAATPGSLNPPVMLTVKGARFSNLHKLLPLRHSSNRNILIYAPCDAKGDMTVIDTNGTPADASDDKVVTIAGYTDQDGVAISVENARYIWEDPSTGYVWVCHSSGVFHINPRDFLDKGTGVAYRPKVARNDGTNLADRLFENVIVNYMTTDGNGRKWFATGGGGVVCTSADGRSIEEELNSDNSPIPSDAVYGLCYLPSSNSMLISTSEGLAEYSLSGMASVSGDGDIKIYPNPVRPDYHGFVTLEGLPERTIVKIVDAAGNIVKELGPATGDVTWDVTNHQFRRVSSGVYFVLASSGIDSNAFSTVGKILVVN